MDLTARQPLVLLAEADALVAEDLSDALKQAGYRVMGPFATTAKALAAIDWEPPALAVLDVKLKDSFCTDLAHELRQRGVPILVHSGLPHDDPHTLSFQSLPWLSKPASPMDVVALLDEMASALEPGTEAAASVPEFQRAEERGNPLIRKLEGFVTLSDADRAILERISAHHRPVGPHVDLIREGDEPDGILLVMEGMACRHKMRENGSRQIMAYLLPGDLGDLDVTLLNTMDHTISTLSACRVVRITPDTIAELMQQHPQIARGIRMSTLVDAATLREWLINVGRRSALERIAHLFCELLVRLQVVGLADAGSYALPLTQTELADTTGLSTIHVNRNLQELRKQELIELKSGRLTILNLPWLKKVGEFKSNYLHLGNRASV